MLAKELASIDVVSGGRLMVGIGAGYLPEEFAAVGVSLSERGRRIDDSIAAMRALWEMAAPVYDGEFVSFAGVDARPRPVQRSLPLVIGGGSEASVRRAIRHGVAFYLFGTTIEMMGTYRAALDELSMEIDRPAHLGELEVYVTPVDGTDAETVARYEELGVDCIVSLPAQADRERRHEPVSEAEILRTIEHLANA